MSFKYKIDGLHTDLFLTKTKIVIDPNGESLGELIRSAGYSFFIMLPEELIHNNLPTVYDSNKKYIAIHRSNLALGDKSWDFDQINHIEYFMWFRHRKLTRDMYYTPEAIERLVNEFIREKQLAVFR